MIFAKATLMLMIFFTSFAAFADVPPRKKDITDTTAKVTGVNNGEVVYNQTVEMATGMRSNGKIYVVVAVLSMILIGLFIYLFTLDRKITKLEKEK